MKNLLLLLFTVLFFSACSSSEDDPKPASLTGTWAINRYQEIEPDGSVNDSDADAGTVEFKDNGSFVFNFQGDIEKGTYVFDEAGKKLTMNTTEDDGEPYNITRTYDVITFTATDLVFEKKELSDYPGEEGIWTDRYELKKR